jgi:DNA (cytosine-5)-methyltransferase 1
MARRLALDEPSLTLTCNPAQKQTERCHPTETRPLSVREYARIQTFPDEWEFTGPISSQYQQIGNAVPVNLAYHIARGIIKMLKSEKEDEDYFLKNDKKDEIINMPQLELEFT